jgi:hypothetical protein
MPKRQLVWVHDDEDPALDPRTFLGTDADWAVTESYVRLATDPEPTLEQLADFCDEQAALCRHLDVVGAHRVLAALLHRRLGRTPATRLLQEIAEYGGLDGLCGAGGGLGAFGDFNVPRDRRVPWALPS